MQPTKAKCKKKNFKKLNKNVNNNRVIQVMCQEVKLSVKVITDNMLACDHRKYTHGTMNYGTMLDFEL